MIKEAKKQKIIKYYLEVKSIKKVMDKFLVSKPTIYNILEEYDIPKPSELRDDKNYENLDPKYPVVNDNGSKTKKLKFNVSGSLNESNEDELGNDLKRLVVYSDYLVKYVRNLREIANIVQEVNNEQRELQQINKFIESTDILEFLKPKTVDLNQSNSELEVDTEKPLIDPTFLMIVANQNITPELKNALIYSKIFTIISQMKPEDFNIQINPNQVKDFINKYNEILKVKERITKPETVEEV
ncbi:hypothetical protein ES703_105695 [subsurface metagenome]